MDTEENAIEKAAAERREWLKTLKMAKVLLETPDDDTKKHDRNLEDAEETEEDEVPSMKFRNYLPHDKQLQEGKLTPVVLLKFEDPIVAAPLAPEKIEDPFLNIAPKKPNWDLRRDVQKKLDKLEKRTQKALYELATFQEDGIAQASRYATEDSIKSWLNELLCLDVASYIPNITMLKITGKLLKEADKEIGHQKTITSLSKSADDSHFLTGSSDKFAKFTNLKYSRVEIDEVRFEWAECMLDYI
ncbi:hypothetical protein ZIOFF_028316 [Zingiber officinale]|uniref:Uncharacterized protein n=1 Tax=Zingiber officinale TaxID=94328 RepID=A0A8J5GPM8_ZINOF|nr:hypothetical protein ZIOFF_028316 [Zingiber officinale]